ncbi:FAD-dependent oxidoreductase [Candidatus Roizmanbacteria bacterium]|nr:FAD-dependent oxidoreductase [Candidatus Roizmanbacteria bacterium]
MNTYRVKLVKKLSIARDTMAFYFSKPPNFQFKPGQYLNMTLINPKYTDDEGNKRFFTIASAPYEENIIIETRLRNTAFKKNLRTMQIGSIVEIKGPFGSFILHNDPQIPAVILSGGIGITPFRSIIYQASYDKLDHKIYLFYSNRTPKDAPNLENLEDLEDKNSNFKLIPTMTKLKPSDIWNGERGYINKDMLAKYLDDLGKAIYYVAGPPNMVSGLLEILEDIGINSDNIRSEDFTGY